MDLVIGAAENTLAQTEQWCQTEVVLLQEESQPYQEPCSGLMKHTDSLPCQQTAHHGHHAEKSGSYRPWVLEGMHLYTGHFHS